ncbi:MAG: hypothetical protein RM338_16050 [Nostoc sp. DedQUE12a]|nr:hypothetical protein [Nostoc sp. DedQUE12a]
MADNPFLAAGMIEEFAIADGYIVNVATDIATDRTDIATNMTEVATGCA